MKMSDYLKGSSIEEKVCKNCLYIMRPIREDLINECFPCQNPKLGKMVKLFDSCSDWKLFSSNPADSL